MRERRLKKEMTNNLPTWRVCLRKILRLNPDKSIKAAGYAHQDVQAATKEDALAAIEEGPWEPWKVENRHGRAVWTKEGFKH